MEVLDESRWRARAAAHEARLAPYLDAHLSRRRAGEKHPVHDFLFGYYSQRPAQLRRWHPGHGVGLAGGEEAYGRLKGYQVVCPTTRSDASSGPRLPVVAVGREHLASQRVLLRTLRRLLVATAGRAASYGCFGLHEWAMVYRLEDGATRHADHRLRLGRDGTDAVVESHRIACTHFDAYRFFTGPARPLNTIAPTAEDRSAFEQPGCLHASMDLYKHAFRLTPLICSDLVADAFELAWDVRELDMRAAPYDLAHLGFAPVRIETAEGKREYAAAQAAFAERAAPLRARLVAQCDRLLEVLDAAAPAPTAAQSSGLR